MAIECHLRGIELNANRHLDRSVTDQAVICEVLLDPLVTVIPLAIVCIL